MTGGPPEPYLLAAGHGEPGGTEGFFREIHRESQGGELTEETMRALDRKYGLTTLGPLPDA